MSTSTYAETASPAPAADPKPRRPNGWLIVGAILTALVLTAGVLTVAGWLGYRTETVRLTYQTRATDISIELDTADVIIRPGEPGVVAVTRRISWSFNRPNLTEEWNGGTLRITGGCGARIWTGLPCDVVYTVAVPPDGSVTARVTTGDITVSDVRNVVQLTTSTGDIRVTGASGELVLQTSSGDIVASALTSPMVDASTRAGDIQLSLAGPPVSVYARANAGDIDIVVPRGETYRVDADAGLGDTTVTVWQDDASNRSIGARTSAGDIDVRYG